MAHRSTLSQLFRQSAGYALFCDCTIFQRRFFRILYEVVFYVTIVVSNLFDEIGVLLFQLFSDWFFHLWFYMIL